MALVIPGILLQHKEILCSIPHHGQLCSEPVLVTVLGQEGTSISFLNTRLLHYIKTHLDRLGWCDRASKVWRNLREFDRQLAPLRYYQSG